MNQPINDPELSDSYLLYRIGLLSEFNIQDAVRNGIIKATLSKICGGSAAEPSINIDGKGNITACGCTKGTINSGGSTRPLIDVERGISA
jgi:hypothetical protein